MELVPIIIAALEVVSALTILTLIISYVRYRMKLKSSVNTKVEPKFDLKPNFDQSRLNKVTRSKKEIANIPKQVNPPLKHKPQKAVKEKPKEAVQVKQKPVVELNSKRLKVIKNLPAQSGSRKESHDKESLKEKKNLSTLGDNIIEKYVDDDDANLFNLETNKEKKKE